MQACSQKLSEVPAVFAAKSTHGTSFNENIVLRIVQLLIILPTSALHVAAAVIYLFY